MTSISRPQPPSTNWILHTAAHSACAAGKVSKSEAKKIALADAGVKAGKAKKVRVEVDRDDGVKIYEVEFRTSEYKYEYDVVVKSGSIQKRSMKALKFGKGSSITRKSAKKIALKHARLKASKVNGLKVKRDTYRGKACFEVEFRRGAWEYEYDVCIKGGKILAFEMDKD